ncbi:hypothetical protein UFOVP1666_67 [uncultured Caudovirales phage]|uniref:Uncharacterized protein n=1 Tax=uncultured Caudovirales phage TaxID=2100421 RepID=A0A6J5T835_9CAUD|nr:hypothetical protein UFOVP867_22 [uncultured Caudovirales phage]CAB4171053.1 hypothetical protein UFOVP913_176 [uncultured Caudovirales phage]CAB4176475.1 hypothetical protein UFOVP993_32 [uncultured Caudovirales phage]CAB4223024.1 hypothetical protein UFOVP1666_67 [uncultured Caudovirales phage]
MALIVTRVTNPTGGGTAKGSALTSVELDANFNNINDNKAELVSPSFTTPILGTPTSGTLTNCTGLPAASITGILSVSHGGTALSTYASGDIIYASAANTLSALAKGSNTQLLTLVGGFPTWTNAPPSGASVVNDTTTATNRYPLFSSVTTTAPTTIYTSDAKYLYKPSTGELQAHTLTASNGFFNCPQAQVDDYTIAEGNSSMSIGPLTIATGKVVTISTGGRWIIV